MSQTNDARRPNGPKPRKIDAAQIALRIGAAMSLFALASYFLAGGEATAALGRNSTRDAALLACGLAGIAASLMGRRASAVYLVAAGLLLLVNAFSGLTRGVFYLDFAALNGPVVPLAGAGRWIAALPEAAFGLAALVPGLRAARDDQPQE